MMSRLVTTNHCQFEKCKYRTAKQCRRATSTSKCTTGDMRFNFEIGFHRANTTPLRYLQNVPSCKNVTSTRNVWHKTWLRFWKRMPKHYFRLTTALNGGQLSPTTQNPKRCIKKKAIASARNGWAEPVIFAPKRDRRIRLWSYYRILNELIKYDLNPTLIMEKFLASLVKAGVVTTCDDIWGNWQV